MCVWGGGGHVLHRVIVHTGQVGGGQGGIMYGGGKGGPSLGFPPFWDLILFWDPLHSVTPPPSGTSPHFVTPPHSFWDPLLDSPTF